MKEKNMEELKYEKKLVEIDVVFRSLIWGSSFVAQKRALENIGPLPF
jgi:hypothetical protein